MVLFELLQLARVFLYYLLIEYLWHAFIMPLTNRNGITRHPLRKPARPRDGHLDLPHRRGQSRGDIVRDERSTGRDATRRIPRTRALRGTTQDRTSENSPSTRLGE